MSLWRLEVDYCNQSRALESSSAPVLVHKGVQVVLTIVIIKLTFFLKKLNLLALSPKAASK